MVKGSTSTGMCSSLKEFMYPYHACKGRLHLEYYYVYTNVQVICSVNIVVLSLPPGVPFGQSTSALTEVRTALLASRALSLNLTMNLSADYTPLMLAEGFYMATMGGAEGTPMYDYY